ncbi:MAG: class I SAM-dependent methyltransferase [Actinomycetota bacterium]|nr:class I SAM-dependent methyltransferase [Actinomycetota bacterium]
MIGKIPGARAARGVVSSALHRARFPGSKEYWERRYSTGGTSGAGSYGRLARYKAEVLNAFVAERSLQRVVEFGCGDGHQLGLATYPEYVGLDVSETALRMCVERFRDDRTKTFLPYDPATFHDPLRVVRGDVSMSLDVIYHLVEDDVFDSYMRHLFAAGDRFVVVYSSNDPTMHDAAAHVRHRRFTDWVATEQPAWRLEDRLPNPFATAPGDSDSTVADFYIYRRTT